MIPQSQIRKPRNSSKVNLLISTIFHGVLVIGLLYFAAREGLLGTKLQNKIRAEMVKEKVEKPKEEKPKPEIKEPEKIVKTDVPRPVQQAPPPTSSAVAPPPVAPPAAEIASISFYDGKTVETATSPVDAYRGLLQSTFQSRWSRPEDMDDAAFVAEVEIDVDRTGQIKNPVFKKTTGNKRWDDSVRQAVSLTKSINHAPPTNFPSHVTVRFDVMASEPVL